MSGSIAVRRKHSAKIAGFDIEAVELALKNGEAERSKVLLCFHRGDAVAVLIYREDKDAVVLTRQYRYPAAANAYGGNDGYLVEIPAGVIDKGETPEETARREVEEEVGYRLGELELIGSFFVSPATTKERITVFFSRVTGDPTGKGGGVASQGELIEVTELPVDEFMKAVERNDIRDAKTLIAGYWLGRRRPGY